MTTTSMKNELPEIRKRQLARRYRKLTSWYDAALNRVDCGRSLLEQMLPEARQWRLEIKAIEAEVKAAIS